MNKFFRNIAATVLVLAALPMAAQEEHAPVVMSLDECIAVAISENPTVQIADMEIQRLDFSKKESFGQLLPTISFDATYSRMLAKQVAYMNMDDFGGFPGMGGGDTSGDDSPAEGAEESKSSGDGGIKMGLDNSYMMGFNASMPLISVQLWKTLKLHDTQILEAVEKSRQSREQLVQQVKSAYYALLLAEDSYKVMVENLEMAKFTAQLYQKQFDLGAASQFDVLRTQVAVKNAEPNVSQAEITIRQARLQLLVLMGIGEYFPIQPNVKLADFEKTMYEQTMAYDRDISQNSDLRLLDIQTTLLDQTLSVQKAAWYPTLALSANYNWTSSSQGNPLKGFRWNPYSVIGLSLSVPIFQGGQRWNRIKQAEIQVGEMRYQKANLENSLRMQVDVAFDNIQQNVRLISSCAESVRQAGTAHDIARQSFEIGAGTYLDLRDSELALTQSRLAYYQAIYNYLEATNNLEKLLGRYNVDAFMPAY